MNKPHQCVVVVVWGYFIGVTMEEKNKGCKFQNDCIEYKEISYLKIMPICAIHELSIACHNKENKCKYYKLYKQLKRLEQENEELKNRLQILDDKILTVEITVEEFENYKQLKQENEELKKLKCKFKEYCTCDTERYRFALEEIREIANQTIIDYTEIAKNNEKLKALDIRNRMSEIQNIISETIGE